VLADAKKLAVRMAGDFSAFAAGQSEFTREGLHDMF